MAKAQGLGLAQEDAAHAFGDDVADHVGHIVIALGAKGAFQFGVRVEMILDRALGAAGDEDQIGDPGGDGLFDGILDDRLVDDGQQLFRHGLGGGQKARAQPRHGKDGLADGRARAAGHGDNAFGSKAARAPTRAPVTGPVWSSFGRNATEFGTLSQN